MKRRAKARPAESVAGVGGLGGLIAALVADNQLAAILSAVVGFLPAVVTYLVAHGGIRGVLRTLWGGSEEVPEPAVMESGKRGGASHSRRR
jgi:Na+(H+)/acetate symporter ActP